MNKNRFIQSGITEDKRIVWKGVFWFSETYGLSLTEILYKLTKDNMLVDWMDYYVTARDSGIMPDRIFERMRHSIVDVIGIKYYNEVMKRIKYLIYMKKI